MFSSQLTGGTGSSVAELRPSGRDYRRRVLPAVPVPALIIGFLAWSQSRSLLLAVAVPLGIILVVSVLVLVTFRELCWRADAAGVQAHGLFGRVRRVPRSDIASVLLATQFRAPRAPTGVFLALRDRSGRGLLRLQGLGWNTGEIERFLQDAHLGPVTRIDEPIDSVSLGRREPGTQTRAAEHPGRYGLIFFGCLVLLLALVFGTAALISHLAG